MSATIIPFPVRSVAGNCRRCGSILEGEPHDCDASLDALRQQLIANGCTAADPDLPPDLRRLLGGASPDDPAPEAA
jgi:hypothetical protein